MNGTTQNLAQKAVRKATRVFRQWRNFHNDRQGTTFAVTLPVEIKLFRYVKPLALKKQEIYTCLDRLVPFYLEHRFDILGSGWRRVRHGMLCRGVEGNFYPPGDPVTPDADGMWLEGRLDPQNLPESKRIWKRVDRDYIPIDWHLDMKSGYRWREDQWHGFIRYGHKPGMDVKVPWELARMQHLCQMALAAQLWPARADVFSLEFRNQVLDFMANNPPHFGVNWASPMDAAIRAANWLLAYDLFRAGGFRFDPDFQAVFVRSVYEHGRFLVHNLEYRPDGPGNHYLADMVGLLFIAAYLPCSEETDAWLAFAVQELVESVEEQFGGDGTNREASTCYHRFSAEMVAYATALVLGLPPEKQRALRRYNHRVVPPPRPHRPAPLPLFPLEESGVHTPFPRDYRERLEKMGAFTRAIMDPKGRVPQIGDNDNGRFFKLLPSLVEETKAREPVEDSLDHRHLLEAVDGLFKSNKGPDFPGVDFAVIQCLARGTYLPSLVEETSPRFRSFPDFGLHVYRWGRNLLVVRCGGLGPYGPAGHAHNDQLSFTLVVEGRPFLIDPGTYVYTPLPWKRNLFRSTGTHNTLFLENQEQNPWPPGPKGLFAKRERADASVIQASMDEFVGLHHGFSGETIRQLKPYADRIEGKDSCAAPGEKTIAFHLAPEVRGTLSIHGARAEVEFLGKRFCFFGEPGFWQVEEIDYSPAYGVSERTSRLLLCSEAQKIRWQVSWEGPGDA
jgi:hypothetical protein